MRMFTNFKSSLAASVCAITLATAAHADEIRYPGGDLKTALDAYTKQTGMT